MRLVLIGLVTVAAAMVIDVQMASLKTAKALGLEIPYRFGCALMR